MLIFSINRLGTKNFIYTSAILILSVLAMCALISHGHSLSPEVKVQKKGSNRRSISTGRLPEANKHRSLRSQVLGDEEPAAAEESTAVAVEEVSWGKINAIFGWHGVFAIIVLIGSIALWVHLGRKLGFASGKIHSDQRQMDLASRKIRRHISMGMTSRDPSPWSLEKPCFSTKSKRSPLAASSVLAPSSL
jgi:hypothetical protein